MDCDFETWYSAWGGLDCAHVTVAKAKARGTAAFMASASLDVDSITKGQPTGESGLSLGSDCCNQMSE